MQTNSIQPLQSENRIWLMDALRGFAILGIFIANLGSGFTFYNPDQLNVGPYFSSFDVQMFKLHHLFIEGKFYSIFSFLFGWGIAIQLQRSFDKGIPSAKLVKRRLVFMFLLGMAHLILLWTGDIVAFYGLVGFLLILIRKWNDRKLIITAILLLLSPILWYFLKMKWPVFNAPSELMFSTGQWLGGPISGIYSEADYIAFIKDMNYWDHIKLNISGVFFRFGDLFFQSRIFKVLGMFIVGYLMGRNFRYKQILANTKLLWTVALIGLAIGLPANYILAKYMANQGDYYRLTIKGLYRTIAYTFSVAPQALAYISLFFLVAKSKVGAAILSPLKAPGKMAFSNYIFHSIIGTIVFQSFGLNYMGKVGPVYYTVFAFIVFFVQIIISKIWLHYFEFGPIEWIWRSCTYGKMQPFKKIRITAESE